MIASVASTERKEQGSTRQNILQLLRRHGEMTALELSKKLKIGAVGVRQHLALLERDGLVEVTGVRRSVGRPSHLYTLTTGAEEQFPKQYAQLALDVLSYIENNGGEEAITAVFRSRRQSLASQIRPRMQGKTTEERVIELSHILAEQGYMCEYERLEDGSLVLTEYNCPIDCVAYQHPQICDQEMVLYEELLGVSLERDATIAEGNRHCRYRIPAQS